MTTEPEWTKTRTRPLNPANPIGNNAVPFDLKEGPTDLRFKDVGGSIVGKVTRPDGSGYFTFRYGRMDLLGSAANPVLVGYSVGDQPSSPSGSVHHRRSSGISPTAT